MRSAYARGVPARGCGLRPQLECEALKSSPTVAAARTIALPFFNTMTEEQVEVVCSTLEVALARIGGAGRA